MAAVNKLLSVDYQVFGKVQGVFFRKYTKTNARQRGLFGWVMNTESGTVTGTMQGPDDKINDMKTWLSKTGSPQSRVDRCEFSNERTIDAPEFSDFSVVDSIDNAKKIKKPSSTVAKTTIAKTTTSSKTTNKSSVTTGPVKK